jgi:hypothetical protein
MALPQYSTGTVSVAAGGTIVTGSGGSWTGINAKHGDFISIGGSAAVLITEVTDATHLKIPPWGGPTLTNVGYVIYQNYVGRVVGVAAAEDVGEMLEKLHTDGLPFIVGTSETVPDPSYGDDGQYAYSPSTGMWWIKSGGVWTLTTAPANIGAVAYAGPQSLTVAQRQQGKTNIGLDTHGASVASASTVDLENVTGDLIEITGTTNIDNVALGDGHERTVRFTTAIYLNAAGNCNYFGVSILTEPGDIAVYRGFSSGTVLCVSYQNAKPAPWRHPLVILATGQSNIATMRPAAWSPPDNLFLWDGYANVLGSAFYPAPQQLSAGLAFAAQVAKATPDRAVYLINLGYGDQPISHWLPGTAAPDMYASCKSNTEAALDLLGLNAIDIFFWWQGETDAINNTEAYPFDFETVIDRFQGEVWFRTPTPTVIMGFSPYVDWNAYVSKFDDTLKQIAAYRPETRTFVSLASTVYSDWEASESAIHMTAGGYYKAGSLAYEAFSSGANSGQNALGAVRVTKRVNTAYASTTTLTDDLEMKCYLRNGKSYRVRGLFRGAISSATEGLKWALVGPAAALIDIVVRTVVGTAETITRYGAYPDAQIVAGGSFSVEFDAFIYITSANGICKLQYAQIVSGAPATYIFPTGTLEIIEVG